MLARRTTLGRCQQVDQPVSLLTGPGFVRSRAADWQVQREHARPEHLLADGEGRGEVGLRAIELGDRDCAGRCGGGAFVPEQPGEAVDSVEGADHEQGRVGTAQAGAQVPDEISEPRCIEKVDPQSPVHRGQRSEVERALPALGVVMIGMSGIGGTAVCSLTAVRCGQQALGQGGLTCSGVADQDDVAHVGAALVIGTDLAWC